MPSTFTDSLRLEEQGVGENNNTWGERLNRTIEFADKAIAGVVDIAVASGTVTLTAQNNSEDEARYRILRLTGTLTGNVTVQVPEVSKEYIIIDATTRGGNSVTFRLGASGATQVLPVLGSTQLATNGAAWITPAFHPASDAEVNTGTNEYKWVTPAGLKQNVDTRLGTSGNLGSAATQDVGTGTDEIPDTEILDTRLGTTGNLGNAAQRDVGTGGANLVETSRLNTRLGTTGNLGTAAQRAVGTATTSISDNAQLNTRLGTTGNLGNAAQRTVGTAASNLLQTSDADSRYLRESQVGTYTTIWTGSSTGPTFSSLATGWYRVWADVGIATYMVYHEDIASTGYNLGTGLMSVNTNTMIHTQVYTRGNGTFRLIRNAFNYVDGTLQDDETFLNIERIDRLTIA